MKKWGLLLGVCLVMWLPSTVSADEMFKDIDEDIQEARSQIQEYKEQVSNKKRTIEELGRDREGLQEEIERVDKLAQQTVDKINQTNTDIGNLNERVNKLYVEIEELNDDLDNREREFKYRIQASSQMDFKSYIQVILEAESFSNLLSNVDFIRTSLKKDNQVIEDFIELSEELKEKKKDQEKVVEQLNEKKELLNSIREKLKIENVENKEKKSDVSGEYDRILNEYRSLQVKIEEEQRLIDRLEKEKERLKDVEQSIGASSGDWSLHPMVEIKRKSLILNARQKGLTIRTTSGFRSFAEQDKLYSQGRNGHEGQIVTNAQGGQSWHNYGVAFDVAFVSNGGLDWGEGLDRNGNGIEDWEEIGRIGESIGLEWGGRWTSFVDKPHFQHTFGKSMSEFYRMTRK